MGGVFAKALGRLVGKQEMRILMVRDNALSRPSTSERRRHRAPPAEPRARPPAATTLRTRTTLTQRTRCRLAGWSRRRR